MSDNTPNGITTGTAPSKPGILAVTSVVLHPDRLNPLDFCDWYENTHIQEVQSTGGISGTQRYESLDFIRRCRQKGGQDVPKNKQLHYDFLTIYNMPNLSFRNSPAFKGLDGQSKPGDYLVEKLFSHAEFITQFCEEVEADGAGSTSGAEAAPFVVTIGIPSTQSTVSMLALSKVAGYRRMRKYKVDEASILSKLERSFPSEPNGIAVVGFDSELDVENAAVELDSAEGLQVGFWALRRNYPGDEKTPAGWRAKPTQITA